VLQAAPSSQWTLVQPFYPLAAPLMRRGFQVVPSTTGLEAGFAGVVVLPGKHKLETLAMLGQAYQLARPGASIVVAIPNKLGGQRYEKMVRKVVGELDSESKHKCRIFTFTRGENFTAPWAEWATSDAEERIIKGRYVSQPGIFGWNKVDQGSKLLVRNLPRRLGPEVLDLGAGWGWLSIQAAKRSGVHKIHMVEADRRALDMAVRNMAEHAPKTEVVAHWKDATQPGDLPRADVVITNPPFHEGSRTTPELGKAFLRSACSRLRSGGKLFMVGNIKLPYEATLREHLARVHVVAEQAGFKVLAGRAR